MQSIQYFALEKNTLKMWQQELKNNEDFQIKLI